NRIVWILDDQQVFAYGPSAYLYATDLGPGAHVVTAKVGDQSGIQATDTVTFAIAEPWSIEMTNPSFDGQVIQTDEASTTTFTAAAHDAAGGDLSAGLWWFSSATGLLGTGPAVEANLFHSSPSQTISAVLYDGNQQIVSQLDRLIRVNHRPEISFATPA